MLVRICSHAHEYGEDFKERNRNVGRLGLKARSGKQLSLGLSLQVQKERKASMPLLEKLHGGVPVGD